MPEAGRGQPREPGEAQASGHFATLVLAGRRGPSDALAEQTGLSHRALLPVAGVPMLVRVLRTLEACPSVGKIYLSIDAPEALADVPELAKALDEGQLTLHHSLESPSRSVADALGALDRGPVLVTTADHALLTPEIVEHFASVARGSDADALLGVVARSLLRAAHPESPRTYVPLRGEAWSGTNLFAFRTPQARRAAEFWIRAERYRKRPWRMLGAVGARALALFALRRLDLEAACRELSRACGCRVRAVPLPFPEAAIDVDRAEDLELATRILVARERSEGPSGS